MDIKVITGEVDTFLNKTDLFDYVEQTIAVVGIAKALGEREKIVTTGVGLGIAIPHAYSELVLQPIILVIRLREAMDFDAVDDMLVDLIFVIINPKDQETIHLRIISQLAGLLLDPELVDDFRKIRLDRVKAIILENIQV